MFSSNTSQVAATATAAEAIDFDGTNDYLSRASDLVGNTDGKTFTFSAWVWDNIAVSGSSRHLYVNFDGSLIGFRVYYLSTAGQLVFTGTNSAGTTILNISISAAQQLLKDTFNNILVSVDLANASNRYAYINDVAASFTVTTYTNDTIDFTKSTSHTVAANQSGAGLFKGRLSNVFLDYTYRDLSIEANRRLFVTADLKPAAGQAALNPILYLPMNDPTAPGANAGTGGNFTLTGTVARSGRGPNQYNAPYSDLDGSADYLSRTSLSGIADSKAFTLSLVVNADTSGYPIAFGSPSSDTRFSIFVFSDQVQVYGYGTAGASILVAQAVFTGQNFYGRNIVITVSIDLADSAKRHIYVNGQVGTNIYSTYVNALVDFTLPEYRVGSDMYSGRFNGRLGALWFNTSYIDLSVATNLAKFVSGTGINAKPVDLGATGELPTGTAPLIYLPMYGNNAGKNYGTGGDFTVNSGPYTGARGPNEFWGNKADFNGTTGYLRRTSALSGVTGSKTMSFSVFADFDVISRNETIFAIGVNSTSVVRLLIHKQATSNRLRVEAKSSANGSVLTFYTANDTLYSGKHHIQFSVDLTNTAKRSVYINGVLTTPTWVDYSNTEMDFTSADQFIGNNVYLNEYIDGDLSELYFTTEYIDFTQEANRLKFRDCFGNPTDLPSAITALSVPNPAIYMRFPPTSFGTNSGTGGNFTVNGTITDGGQL